MTGELSAESSIFFKTSCCPSTRAVSRPYPAEGSDGSFAPPFRPFWLFGDVPGSRRSLRAALTSGQGRQRTYFDAVIAIHVVGLRSYAPPSQTSTSRLCHGPAAPQIDINSSRDR